MECEERTPMTSLITSYDYADVLSKRSVVRFFRLVGVVLHQPASFRPGGNRETKLRRVRRVCNQYSERSGATGGRGFYIIGRLSQRCNDIFNTRRVYAFGSFQSHAGRYLARSISARSVGRLCHQQGLCSHPGTRT